MLKATRKRTGKIRSNLHTCQYTGSVSPDHGQGQMLVEPLGLPRVARRINKFQHLGCTFRRCKTVVGQFTVHVQKQFFVHRLYKLHSTQGCICEQTELSRSKELSLLLKIDSVYLAIRSKSTGGAFLLLSEPFWLNWSCDKDDTFGLAYGLCQLA